MRRFLSNEGVKEGYPLRYRYVAAISSSSMRTVADIDTELLLDITSTADDLSGGTNIDDLERSWTPKIRGFSDFFRDFRLRHTFKEWIYAEITGDRPRQPAYEIKLVLSRVSVSWALAQVSCFQGLWVWAVGGEFLGKRKGRVICVTSNHITFSGHAALQWCASVVTSTVCQTLRLWDSGEFANGVSVYSYISFLTLIFYKVM